MQQFLQTYPIRDSLSWFTSALYPAVVYQADSLWGGRSVILYSKPILIPETAAV